MPEGFLPPSISAKGAGEPRHGLAVNPGRLKERDPTVDYFRFAALLTIMCSHSPGIAGTWFNSTFMCLNVMFMVLPSALGTRLSTRHRPYRVYMWEKFRAIVLSAYIFVAFLWYGHTHWNFPANFDIAHYLRLSDYLWFTRGYLLCYAFAPVVRFANTEIQSHSLYFGIIGLISLVMDVVNPTIRTQLPQYEYEYTVNVVQSFYFPLAFAIYYRMVDMRPIYFWCLWGCIAGLFGLLQYKHYVREETTNVFEYSCPMSITFSAYGVMCSMLLYKAAPVLTYVIEYLGLQEVAKFTSAHSLWVYNWNFLFAFVCVPGTPLFFEGLILFLIGFCFTQIQVNIVNRIAANMPYDAIAHNLRLILT